MRLPIAPNVIIPASRAAGHHPTPPDRQTYVDAVIIPMRRVRTPEEGLRHERSGRYPFDPAPAWAATLVDQLASLVLRDSQDYAELLRVTRRLCETEERARAALSVIETLCARSPISETERDNGEDDAVFRALGVFGAATLLKRLDALP